MIQHSNLLDELKNRIEKARLYNSPILYSIVEKVQNEDPLHYFNIGEKYFAGQRFYWSDFDNQFSIAGIGSEFTIEMNAPQFKYSKVEEIWKQLLEVSSIDHHMYPNGTGPILFGGFSFDALKEKSGLWKDFPNAKFVLPKFSYSVIKGQAYLTTNIICKQTSDADTLFNEMNSMKTALSNVNQISGKHFDNAEYSENEVDPEGWMESVKRATKSIQNGDLEKVVLARETRLTYKSEIDIANVISQLSLNQVNSYIFAFESNENCFVGASPERLIKKENNLLFSTCLAGSIARGKTKLEDEELGEALLQDRKNLIEHEVVVHMIKEAMEEVCRSISAPSHPTLYKTHHIQHLFTPVIGEVANDISLFSVIEKLHPTPALGGYPKGKALQMIREIEMLDRGWYAAPIGWIDFKGDGEFAVAIRSGLIQGNEVSLFAGCGIVGDSDPVSEYHETKLKFKPMLSALGGIKHENN